jgi:hypothetical protein
MAKLKTKERKELPDEIFGLPSERKYPLTDEEHVRKAIQFFKYCPPSKRNELAKNINRRAKELGMKLKLSKDGVFYKYADKTIVQESAYDAYEFQRLVETGEGEVAQIVSFIQTQTGLAIQSLMKRLFIMPTLVEFIEVEKELQNLILGDNFALPKTFKSLGREHAINPITHINKAMEKSYDLLFSFMKYNNPNLDFSTHYLITSIFEDITFYLIREVQDCACFHKFVDKMKLIDVLINHFDCNMYYVIRKIREVHVQCIIEKRLAESQNDKERVTKLLKISDLLTAYITKLKDYCSNNWHPVILKNDASFISILRSSNMNLIHSIDYLKTLKNELKSEIDIILMSQDISIIRDEFYHNLNFLLDIVDREHREILDIISMLEGGLIKRNIKLYNKNYSLELDSKDILAFKELNLFDRLYVGKGYGGDNVYYGVTKDKLYLLGKTNKLGGLVLIKLYDNGECLKPLNLIVRDKNDFDKTDRLKSIKINIIPSSNNNLEALTEGITIDKDGGIKFTFKPRKSYMDEYAENHKLLVENFKARNYEAMKTNLAFLFALINDIERNVIYSKKPVSLEKKRDAEKARMFAINDFKTYLKEIQKVEPSFDFTKYYEESDFGKLTIRFSKDELIGLKRLFQTIILS